MVRNISHRCLGKLSKWSRTCMPNEPTGIEKNERRKKHHPNAHVPSILFINANQHQHTPRVYLQCVWVPVSNHPYISYEGEEKNIKTRALRFMNHNNPVLVQGVPHKFTPKTPINLGVRAIFYKYFSWLTTHIRGLKRNRKTVKLHLLIIVSCRKYKEEQIIIIVINKVSLIVSHSFMLLFSSTHDRCVFIRPLSLWTN